MYCTPIDLIAYANKARLIGQLAGSDFGEIPTADEVLDYFFKGSFADEKEQSLRLIASRVEQAITNATGEINGYKALFPKVYLPVETLKTACMDIALYRLFEILPDDSVVKQNADNWISFFDKIATGKIPVNADDDTDDDKEKPSTHAQTIGDDVIFNADTLRGY